MLASPLAQEAGQESEMSPGPEWLQDTERLERRKKAAQLLEDVLDERVSPQFAINRWPEGGPVADPSLDAAWQALWHFEADEQQQQNELFYMDAQLALLTQMAGFLRDGHDLPGYLMQVYPPEHRIRFFYDRSFPAEGLQNVRTFWGWFSGLWKAAWMLNPMTIKVKKPPQN